MTKIICYDGLVDYQVLLYQTICKQPIWKTDENRFPIFIVVLLLIYLKFVNIHERLKGLFLCLRQFLITENPLKIMKNAFYLIFNALLCLKNFYIFWSWLFGYVGKWLDKKAEENFKIYDATDWTANNYSRHIATISRSNGN